MGICTLRLRAGLVSGDKGGDYISVQHWLCFLAVV